MFYMHVKCPKCNSDNEVELDTDLFEHMSVERFAVTCQHCGSYFEFEAYLATNNKREVPSVEDGPR